MWLICYPASLGDSNYGFEIKAFIITRVYALFSRHPASPFDRSNIWPGNGSASSEVVTRHSIPKIGKFEFYASVINSSAPSARRKRVPPRSISRVSNLLSISSEPIHYFVWLDNATLCGAPCASAAESCYVRPLG